MSNRIEVTVIDEERGEIVNTVTCESESLTDLAFAFKGAVAPYQHVQSTKDKPYTIKLKVDPSIEQALNQTIAEIEGHIQAK